MNDKCKIFIQKKGDRLLFLLTLFPNFKPLFHKAGLINQAPTKKKGPAPTSLKATEVLAIKHDKALCFCGNKWYIG
jgi:hypothetical protein